MPFVGVIGGEEVTGAAILPEPLGRATLPAAAVLVCLAGLGTLGFCIQVAFGRAWPRVGFKSPVGLQCGVLG